MLRTEQVAVLPGWKGSKESNCHRPGLRGRGARSGAQHGPATGRSGAGTGTRTACAWGGPSLSRACVFVEGERGNLREDYNVAKRIKTTSLDKKIT